jgi:hypothetical protein
VLQVASEDTVLYTADAYVRKTADLQQRQTGEQLLAPLVRAQHLSQFWLSAAALCPSTPTLLHGSYAKQLRQLLLLKASVGNLSLQATELHKQIPKAPDSWVLGRRIIREVGAVEMLWNLDVSTLASTAQLSAGQQQRMLLNSPIQTPPIGGVAFGIQVQMTWQRDAQGSTFCVYVKPKNAPADTYLKYKFTLSVAAAGNRFNKQLSSGTPMVGVSARSGWGWNNFFETGAMSGGWDAAAWAKAGLPTTGELVLKLSVKNVAHTNSSG